MEIDEDCIVVVPKVRHLHSTAGIVKRDEKRNGSTTTFAKEKVSSHKSLDGDAKSLGRNEMSDDKKEGKRSLSARDQRARARDRRVMRLKLTRTSVEKPRVKIAPQQPRLDLPKMLQDLSNNDPVIKKILDTMPVLNHKTLEDAELRWSSATPCLLPVDSCFEGQPPTHDDLWAYVEKVPLSTPNTYNPAGELVPFREMLKELFREAKTPLTSMFIKIHKKKWRLRPPKDMGLQLIDEKQLDNTISINLSIQGAHVPFHVDTGMAGLTLVSDNCVKLWMIAEMTSHNFDVFLKSRYDVPTLLKGLQKPVLLQQTSAHAIYLPTGTIHATWTISSGLLYGNNFHLRPDADGVTMGLICVLEEKGCDDKDDAWVWYFNYLEDALGGNDFVLQERLLAWLYDKRMLFHLAKWKREGQIILSIWKRKLKEVGFRFGPLNYDWYWRESFACEEGSMGNSISDEQNSQAKNPRSPFMIHGSRRALKAVGRRKIK